MLVETVHVQLAHERINDSVYLKNRIFTFRVAKKLEKKIQKGMLVFSKNGQLVYVKNIITGKSEEEENEYTATVSKIFKAEQVDDFYMKHKNEIKERVLAISFSTGVSEDELVGQDKKRNSCKLAYINSVGELLEKTDSELSGMEARRDRSIKKTDFEIE